MLFIPFKGDNYRINRLLVGCNSQVFEQKKAPHYYTLMGTNVRVSVRLSVNILVKVPG